MSNIVWIPTAHLDLVVERENGEIIAAGLGATFNSGAIGDCVTYILTDDSVIEQRAIRLAFPGINAGE